MSKPDLSRIAEAARKFIVTLERATKRADAPGYDQHRLQLLIRDAAMDLNLTLEGRTMFDPPRDDPDPIAEAFSSMIEYEASIPIKAMRHNLPRLLRWVGFRDPHNIGPKGGLPSLVGITDVTGDVTAEFNALELATNDLEEIVKRTEQAPGKPPTKPEDVGDGSKPPTTRKPMKEPSVNAFAAYRAVKLSDLKQEDVGRQLGVEQSTISRWVRDVGKWIEAGNVLPDELAAPPPRPKTFTMDPSKLERGPRRGRRA